MSASAFYAPHDLNEALKLLAHPERPEILAGGTDLWPKWSSGQPQPRALLSLHRISELRPIRLEQGKLRLGAMATHSDLRRSEDIIRHAPSVAAAAATIGAVQIQNQGTLGGNLINASPAADLVVPLAALDAQVELHSLSGPRWLPLDRFYTGYRTLDRRPDELLVAVHIPLLPTGGREYFRKVGTRRAQAISKVVGSARLVFDPDHKIIEAGLAFGSIAPTVRRLYDLERWLCERTLDESAIDQAARLAEAAVTPIDDLRSTAAYRTHVVGQLVKRWLLGLDGV